MSKFERDLNALSVEFHNSVARDRHRGIQSSSRVTMSIETDLRMIQQKTVDLSRVRNDVMQHIQSLRQQGGVGKAQSKTSWLLCCWW